MISGNSIGPSSEVVVFSFINANRSGVNFRLGEMCSFKKFVIEVADVEFVIFDNSGVETWECKDAGEFEPYGVPGKKVLESNPLWLCNGVLAVDVSAELPSSPIKLKPQ